MRHTSILAVLMRRHLLVFDTLLALLVLMLIGMSYVNMRSAALDWPGRLDDHLRNLLLAIVMIWAAANVPPRLLARAALPLYLLGIVLLGAVEVFGEVSKGAQRWLDLGFTRIQPSEMMKITMPLMLAWWYGARPVARWRDHLVALALLAVPVALIVKQPDLGTAILVFASGGFVVFFAGLSWKAIITVALAGLAALPMVWRSMHDYQRERVMTLIDPSTDPLGKGFHIIQSEIAVGSGGLWGKGWTQGTQTHLEFIPERTTDFIFAVFGEEWGLVGAGVLLAIYLIFVGRGLAISAGTPDRFEQLLAGALAMMFFTYAFVNMGMVTGVLPVVGVPLPLMSYGGTAMVTLGLGIGILMSIARRRPGQSATR